MYFWFCFWFTRLTGLVWWSSERPKKDRATRSNGQLFKPSYPNPTHLSCRFRDPSDAVFDQVPPCPSFSTHPQQARIPRRCRTIRRSRSVSTSTGCWDDEGKRERGGKRCCLLAVLSPNQCQPSRDNPTPKSNATKKNKGK